MENKKEVTTTPTKREKKKEERRVEEDLEKIMSRPIMAKDFAKIVESQKNKPY